jgi:hypothetical protein
MACIFCKGREPLVIYSQFKQINISLQGQYHVILIMLDAALNKGSEGSEVEEIDATSLQVPRHKDI